MTILNKPYRGEKCIGIFYDVVRGYSNKKLTFPSHQHYHNPLLIKHWEKKGLVSIQKTFSMTSKQPSAIYIPLATRNLSANSPIRLSAFHLFDGVAPSFHKWEC